MKPMSTSTALVPVPAAPIGTGQSTEPDDRDLGASADEAARHALAIFRLPDADERTLWEDFAGELKPTTRATYESKLRGFARWLDVPVTALPAVVLANDAGAFTAAVVRYKRHLTDAGRKPATVNLSIAAIGFLVQLLHRVGRIDWTLKVRGLKAVRYRDVEGPGERAVRDMLAELQKPTPFPAKAARDAAMLLLGVTMGLRRSEVVNLDVEDVVLDAEDRVVTLHVLGKARDEKEPMTVPRRTGMALAEWLRHRRGFVMDPRLEPGAPEGARLRTPLFVACTNSARKTRAAERMTDEGFAWALGTLARRAGISKRVRCHSLRHQFVTSSLRAGARLEDVAEAARHRDPKVTMLYRDRLEDTQGRIADLVDRLF